MPNPDRYELPVTDPELCEAIPGEEDREVAVYHERTGLRIVLDDDYEPNDDMPNILIERQKGMWLIIIHPDGGDPLCDIEIHDTGRAEVQDAGGTVLYKEDRGPYEDEDEAMPEPGNGR